MTIPRGITLWCVFLSYSITWAVSSYTNAFIMEKVYIFRAMIDSDFLLSFIIWGLSRFRPSQNIGTPEEYYQSTSHAPIFNFLVSMWCGQTPTSYLSPFDRYNVPEGEERGKTTIWDDTCVEEVLPLDIMFYSKGALLINNFNKVLQCVWPGFTVSIGYITNNFNSRSKQTFWLNYKHVREGKSSG